MLTIDNVGAGFKALCREMGTTTGRNRLSPRADVTLYRNLVLRNRAQIDVPERVKCNRKAAQLRQEGNRLYLGRKFTEAVGKYNESIRYAEPGSEHLGMGYANRSAIYFEEGEYEYALANIALARENRYPKKLMPKLTEREQRCRDQLAAGKGKGTTVPPFQLELDLNVPRNGKIPFVADGIEMGRFPAFGGRGLVAKKDFKPGDLILNERPMLTLLSSVGNYCNNCAGEFQRSLIPCGGCVRAMYCSEECLQEDYRYWHRFQCGLMEHLKNVEYVTAESGPKRFFYTLAAFGDDLDAMMTFCASKGKEDPFTVDHTKADRILEAMKVLHNAKPKQAMPDLEMIVRMAAAAYYVVFMKHPLLQQIAKTNAQKDFILRSFQDYIYKNTILSLNCLEFAHFTNINVVSSISGLANHSCDPNTLFFLRHGRLRFYVIRPIRAGEQITVSYGPTWWDPMPGYQSVYKCRCPVCDDDDSDWVVREGSIPAQVLRELHATTPSAAAVSRNEREAKELRRLLDFMGRYGEQYHPDGALGPKLQVIKHLLAGIVHVGAWTLERAQVAEKIAREI